MAFIVLGLNHQSAPIEIRERLSFSAERVQEALQQIQQQLNIPEALILSTCNRTEIYAAESHIEPLIQWLANYHQLPLDSLQPYLYFHHEQAAMRHATRVASGLDSLILGEPQIFGQLKDAYDLALQANTIKRELHQRFQVIFHLAKKVRNQTDIGKNPVSIAFAAVALAKQIFADLNRCTILLIGAGETIQLVAKHFVEQKVNRLLFVNRTLSNAIHLADSFNSEAFELTELPLILGQADIIVAATASQTILLNTDTMQKAFQHQKRRPVLLLDLAVPRNIEQDIADMRDRYLYTIDDLKNVILETLKSRQQAAEQAEKIIDQAIIEFYQKLKLGPKILAWRTEAEQLRDEQLELALKRLSEGQPVEMVITQLAQKLTQKLLHQPSRWWQTVDDDDNF